MKLIKNRAGWFAASSNISELNVFLEYNNHFEGNDLLFLMV